jgi:2-dehydro-3-deoxygalactonokinase
MYTGMCGEFIAAMSEHTLLKHSLSDPVLQTILPERLIFGYEYAKTHGVSPSLIKTRNVQLWHNWTRDEAANFFVGAILCDDIRTVLRIVRDDMPLVVGGGDPLRTVFATLLAHEGVKNLVIVDDETARIASNVGAMMVYREHIRQYHA